MQLDSASNTSFYNIYEMFQNLKKKRQSFGGSKSSKSWPDDKQAFPFNWHFYKSYYYTLRKL